MKGKKLFAEDIVAEVRKDYERRREDRKPLELQWQLNMNFVNGNQYMQIMPTGEVEEFGKQYFWQEREVYNHIASVLETRMSKLTRVNTGLTVRPFSTDESDIQAAKLSTALISAVAEQNELSSLINDAVAWSEVTGSCFFKVVWDKDMGDVLCNDKGKNPVSVGDVRITVVPPFEIFPDNVCAGSLEECNSIIHAKAYPVSEIEDRWGVRTEGEEVNVFTLDNAAVAGGLGYNASVGNVISSKVDGYAVVIERYTRPTKDKPSGELVIVAGDKLLYYGDLPYITDVQQRRGFPFAQTNCIKKVGSFFGTSVVERMIPLQRSYNAVKNRKHEYPNRISMGILAVEDGSVDMDNLEEEGLSPGKVLIYRQGSNIPRFIETGSVPADFTYEEERLLSEFVTVSGVSELSKYSQTYGNMSGKAISLLVNQDDTRMSLSTASLRICIKRVCRIMLYLYKQFATEKTLKRISGENGEPELTYFNGNDLQCEDLVFNTQDDVTETVGEKRSMVLELIRMGVLTEADGTMSPRTKVKVLEMLGIGNWESAKDVDETQRKRAMKENLSLGKEQISACPYDDHSIHITEHIKCLLEESVLKDKKLYGLMDAHIKEHQMFEMMDESAAAKTLSAANQENANKD